MCAPTWTYDMKTRARHLPEMTKTRAQTFENIDTHSKIQKAMYLPKNVAVLQDGYLSLHRVAGAHGVRGTRERSGNYGTSL